jgi:hypothetical protein
MLGGGTNPLWKYRSCLPLDSGKQTLPEGDKKHSVHQPISQ